VTRTENWRLIDLGAPEPLIAQTFYEAVAEAVDRGISPNTLIMLQPGSPYVCVGYHQDVGKEVDLEYCKAEDLPVIRRSQGGGATYLDNDQVFYQIVAKGSTVVPAGIDAMFERLLSVTVETCRRLGVPAEFKPLNDVVASGKKISGNGAGLQGSTTVLVGNIILDMDYDQMARVLRVPDEKFRDKMARSMRDWVTTLRRELATAPTGERVREVYTATFQELLDVKLTKSQPTDDEWMIFDTETRPRHTSREWLYMEAPYSSRRPGRAVKIAGDVKVVEVDHKARKLIRVRAEVKGDKLLDLRLAGDFFALPKEAIFLLERRLVGARIDEERLTPIVEDFYCSSGAQIPGIEVGDFVSALMKIREYL
jgi:lipoate-protein ligase A